MKLNHDSLWTITKLHLKVLTAVEIASKNSETVPLENIKRLTKTNCNYTDILTDLCKSKFLRYETLPYVGYRLTTSGYDCLAVSSLRKRGLNIMGDKIGIGKESDIYYGEYNNKSVVLKFHRLGRTSFRTVKNNRDYHGNRKHCSWLYLSKLSAESEYKYMLMFDGKINIPKPIDHSRHVIVMEYLEEYVPLYCAKDFDLDTVYFKLMDSIEKFWKLGYVHGDFNEFNIMIDCKNDIKIIDLPQCIAITNEKADEHLQRDINGVKVYFKKKFRYENEYEQNVN